jgi:hypothetical protein
LTKSTFLKNVETFAKDVGRRKRILIKKMLVPKNVDEKKYWQTSENVE